MTDNIELKDAREKVAKLLAENALSPDNSEERLDEIEALLELVLEQYSENVHAIDWVFHTSRKGSEIEDKAFHVLYILDIKKPFPAS
jgi:hypothetical protein